MSKTDQTLTIACHLVLYTTHIYNNNRNYLPSQPRRLNPTFPQLYTYFHSQNINIQHHSKYFRQRLFTKHRTKKKKKQLRDLAFPREPFPPIATPVPDSPRSHVQPAHTRAYNIYRWARREESGRWKNRGEPDRADDVERRRRKITRARATLVT